MKPLEPESDSYELIQAVQKERISKIENGILKIKQKYQVNSLFEFDEKIRQGSIFLKGTDDYFVFDNFEESLQRLRGILTKDKNMVNLFQLEEVASKDFPDIVKDVEITRCTVRNDALFLPDRLLVNLKDDSTIYVCLSYILKDPRSAMNVFEFLWECDNLKHFEAYLYVNLPDKDWQNIETYPYRFHSLQVNHRDVEASLFAENPKEGFRDFMEFVRRKIKIRSGKI